MGRGKRSTARIAAKLRRPASPFEGVGEDLQSARKTYPVGYITDQGYRRFLLDGKQVMEHRWVMAQVMARELYGHENVHHLNGDRLDNRPGNLEIWVKRQPSGQRVSDVLAWLANVYPDDLAEVLAGPWPDDIPEEPFLEEENLESVGHHRGAAQEGCKSSVDDAPSGR